MAGIAEIAQLLLQANQSLPDKLGGVGWANLAPWKSSPIVAQPSKPLAAYGSQNSPFIQSQNPEDLKELLNRILELRGTLGPQRRDTQLEGQTSGVGKPLEILHDPFTPGSAFTSDPKWVEELANFKKEFPGMTDAEIYNIMFKESSYDPTIRAFDKYGNPTAVGLFQLMPSTITDLNERGVGLASPEQIEKMSPSQQLREYAKYVRYYQLNEGFDPGRMPLALLQAAPGRISNYDNMDADTVIYKIGSSAWKHNKAWRSKGNGPITLGSLMAWSGRKWQPPNSGK